MRIRNPARALPSIQIKWIRILTYNQCCWTRTAGTVTFCLSGTGTHYGSGSEAGFGTGNNVKWNFFKSKKVKMSGQLSGEIMLFLSLKRHDSALKNCWKTSWYGTGTGTGTELFQNRNQNRNKPLRFHKHWARLWKKGRNLYSGSMLSKWTWASAFTSRSWFITTALIWTKSSIRRTKWSKKEK